MSDPTSIKTQSKGELLLARSRFYQALSLFFRHPALIGDWLSTKKMFPIWQDAAKKLNFSNESQMSRSLKLLIEDLNKVNASEWIREYESCFGHTAYGAVPVYELEYGEEHSYRQPQQLGDIAAFYKAFGLKINKDIHERVDHFAIECSFMHYLTFKEAYALQHDGEEKAEICREASKRFLLEHLGRWAPSLAIRLDKYAKEGPMKHLADLTLAYIMQDCEHLSIKAGPQDLPLRTIIKEQDSGCVTCSLKPELPS